jgi:hypothetical protein
MHFKTEPKSRGLLDPDYHPELLTAGSAECRKCREDVDLRRALGAQVSRIVDDQDLSRSEIKRQLTELVLDFNRYFRQRGRSVLAEDES